MNPPSALGYNLTNNFTAFAYGAPAAIVLAAVLAIIYRLIVGRARPLSNEVIGTTIAAVAGALAGTCASIILDTGGSGTRGIGGPLNPWLALAAALLVASMGAMLARRFAGSHGERSVATDIVPLGGALVLGFVCMFVVSVFNNMS